VDLAGRKKSDGVAKRSATPSMGGYEQVAAIIFTDETSSVGPLASFFCASVAAVAVVPVVPVVAAPAAGPPAEPGVRLSIAALPVIWTLWPTCLSRSSVPPESAHDAAAFAVADDAPAVAGGGVPLGAGVAPAGLDTL